MFFFTGGTESVFGSRAEDTTTTKAVCYTAAFQQQRSSSSYTYLRSKEFSTPCLFGRRAKKPPPGQASVQKRQNTRYYGSIFAWLSHHCRRLKGLKLKSKWCRTLEKSRGFRMRGLGAFTSNSNLIHFTNLQFFSFEYRPTF